MNPTKPKVRIGIAQISSVHLNLEASLVRLEEIVRSASRQGVQLLVFGETWLSGYPAWIDHCPDVARWDYEPMKDVYLRMYQNGVSVQSPEFDRILGLAREHKLAISLGVNEVVDSGPGNGSLYNSLLLISADGKLVNHRRKLMPTYTEKMLYALGDACDLIAADLPVGRVGGMICWEHWMPLTRQALHDSGEDIHIAAWPTVYERHQIASRHYAFEGRCFVVAAGQILKVNDFPPELELPMELKGQPDEYVLRGGSCIINPRGEYILEPVFDVEELLIAEVDLTETIREQMTLDVSGHYQRDDVFEFTVNRSRRSAN